jgi:hypothetical protein
LTAHGLKAARLHLAYLERDGVERDGSPGRLYGADEQFNVGEFRTPLKNEPRQFRFIVSPDDGHRLDLTEFTRQFMRQVEKDTGRRLIWAAVNHHNTDNPHVHIVIRGVDRDGDELRIDGRYIGREMRWRAQEIATRELGPRLERQFWGDRVAEAGRERLTEMDKALATYLDPNRAVTLAQLLARSGDDGRLCLARLKTLETLELAKQERGGTWRLEENWQKSLVELGQRQDIIERLQPFIGQRAIAYQEADSQTPVPEFDGVVVGKGLDDELAGTMFVAIATPAGEPWYLRVSPDVAESLRQGESVRVGTDIRAWLKPADRIIARFALDNGGIYDPARHQSALENLRQQQRQPGEPSPAERVTANVRRLDRLARFRLANRLPDGRWQVPADLIAQLQEREKTHPQYRLRIEPLAAAQRREFVQALEKKTGFAYVNDPASFRGRLLVSAATRSGAQHVAIVDEAARRFTLVPNVAGAERMHGRMVVMNRGPEGQVAIRVGPEISR